jgi:hypothetical protein
VFLQGDKLVVSSLKILFVFVFFIVTQKSDGVMSSAYKTKAKLSSLAWTKLARAKSHMAWFSSSICESG